MASIYEMPIEPPPKESSPEEDDADDFYFSSNDDDSSPSVNGEPDPQYLVRQLLQTELDNSNGVADETNSIDSHLDESNSIDSDLHVKPFIPHNSRQSSVTECAMIELIECCDKAGTPLFP
jgi:hypothetical protein